MIRARVTGSVTATVKEAPLVGLKLMRCTPEGDGPELVAVDVVGAGQGDTVLIATGSAARIPAKTSGAPVDATIVAIVDA